MVKELSLQEAYFQTRRPRERSRFYSSSLPLAPIGANLYSLLLKLKDLTIGAKEILRKGGEKR